MRKEREVLFDKLEKLDIIENDTFDEKEYSVFINLKKSVFDPERRKLEKAIAKSYNMSVSTYFNCYW